MRQAENKKGTLYGNTKMGDYDTGKMQNAGSLRQSSAKKNEITAADLSAQEIEYICGQITPKTIRTYFQQYPQEFAKIRPGIRATSLPDDMTIQLVTKNISKRFVSSLINKYLSVWREEIKEYQYVLEMEGESPQKALLKTIVQSVFGENVPLFFRVTGRSCSEEYVALTEEAILLLKEKQKQEENSIEVSEEEKGKSKTDLEIENLQRKITQLSSQTVQLRQEFEIEKNAYLETQNVLSERCSELESKLTTIKGQFKKSEDKAAGYQAELEKIRRLSKYSDEDIGEEQSEDYQFISIAQVFTDYNGKRCRRLADVENRKVRRFIRNEEEPPYFSNRDKLPLFDGPDTDGFIGVWNWSAIENYKDSSKDYIRMQYNSSIKYIEVVELAECHSCKDVSEYLAGNTFSGIAGSKILFGYRASEKEMSCLLCGTRELEVIDGSVRLKKEVCVLPQYQIDIGDVLDIAGQRIYRHLSMGNPQNIFQIKSPMEVVKNIVIKRATSARLRQRGLSVKETQHCQTFIRELPEETVYQEIMDAYGCTEAEAQEYLSAFIEQADSYLTESDLDMETLGAAVERNEGLVKKCKGLLLEDWERENAGQLCMARTELEKLQNAVSKERDIYASCKEQHGRVQEELERFQEELARQEKLAQDVEEKIADRISAARKDAADFISEMAFAVPDHFGGKGTQAEGGFDRISVTYRKREYLWGNDITDMNSFVEELADNLYNMGYEEGIAAQMSQMLSFAICSKIPVVCGDHAEKIGDCVSAMFGEEGVCELTLPIGESCCKSMCDFISQELLSADRVFVINGIFDGFSLNAFREIRQRWEEWGRRAILIFSLSGVNAEMVPDYVWNRVLFMDGDIGIADFERSTLQAFHSSVEFTCTYDEEDFSKKRRLLKKFYGIIDNTAILNYAKYLAVTGGTIEPDELLLLQILLCAKAAGKGEKFLEILSSMEFDMESDRYLAKYL